MNESVGAAYESPVQRLRTKKLANKENSPLDVRSLKNILQSKIKVAHVKELKAPKNLHKNEKKPPRPRAKKAEEETVVGTNARNTKTANNNKAKSGPPKDNVPDTEPNNSIKKATQSEKSKSNEANQSEGSSATETSGYNSSLNFQSLHRTTVRSTSVEDNVSMQTGVNKTLKNDSAQTGKRLNNTVDKSKPVHNVSKNDKEAIYKFIENNPLKSILKKNSPYSQKATGTEKKETKKKCRRQSKHVWFEDTSIKNKSTIKKASKGTDKGELNSVAWVTSRRPATAGSLPSMGPSENGSSDLSSTSSGKMCGKTYRRKITRCRM